ncbi:putative bifunctional TENA-E protein [Salvia divinorum]|uniref:Bifunctional TENA-E protein n=1 Tax=Salvia divinorum TaxID=28513 RepID=A0ABD1FZZ8_SALDI
MERATVTETWLRKHRQIYLRATQHPFILSIRDGSLHLSSFKRWLGQDYVFVRAFVPFIASILVKAWKEGDDEANIDIILSGIATLNDEVSWFKKEASKWGVALDSIVPQQANLAYCRNRLVLI